jgi:hypothetical protein
VLLHGHFFGLTDIAGKGYQEESSIKNILDQLSTTVVPINVSCATLLAYRLLLVLVGPYSQSFSMRLCQWCTSSVPHAHDPSLNPPIENSFKLTKENLFFAFERSGVN